MSWQSVPRFQVWVGGVIHGVYLLKEHAEEVADRLRKKGRSNVEIREGYRV